MQKKSFLSLHFYLNIWMIRIHLEAGRSWLSKKLLLKIFCWFKHIYPMSLTLQQYKLKCLLGLQWSNPRSLGCPTIKFKVFPSQIILTRVSFQEDLGNLHVFSLFLLVLIRTIPAWYFFCFGTVLLRYILSHGTVPSRYFLRDGTVPSRYFLCDGTVPSRYFLQDGTVPSPNHYLIGNSVW